jgi:hypothetical protein
MKVVYEKEILLKDPDSQQQIWVALREVFSAQKMLFEVLIPLAEEEEWIENLFIELEEKKLLWEEAPDADRHIHLHENLLTVTISHGLDITENVQALYN